MWRGFSVNHFAAAVGPSEMSCQTTFAGSAWSQLAQRQAVFERGGTQLDGQALARGNLPEASCVGGILSAKVSSAGPWQDERAAPGLGVVGCRRRWAERLVAWACPSCLPIGPTPPPGPGLPGPGDGLVSIVLAIETCDAEIIHKSLVDACNNNVSDSELILGAREMLDNVLFLRQQLLKAVESMDLQRLHGAVEAANAHEGLPEKDLANAIHILEELKTGELGRLERHLKAAAESGDFRALDALLQRAENAKELGVQVEELDLDHYQRLARKHQAANIQMLQEDLQRYRLSTDWPAVLDRPKEDQEGPTPDVVEVVQLPSVVVAGQVQLDLYPRGIRKEFLTLPREIVEAKIQIALPDASEDVEPVMEARSRLEELTESIQAMLADEDELRKIGGMEIQDDGAYRHVTLPIALYLSASTSSQEIIEAFFEVPEETEVSEGRSSSRALHRSKSFNSKRRAVKGLWLCLRRLGHTRPELNSHWPGSDGSWYSVAWNSESWTWQEGYGECQLSPPLRKAHRDERRDSMPFGRQTGAGAEKVTLALTVQGPQQALAMVNGKKQIENRSWKIPLGWYALHVGGRPLAVLGEDWLRRKLC
eukprot:s446_g17.t4